MATAAGPQIEKALETAKRAAAEPVGGPARLKVVLVLGAILGLDGADKAAVSAIASSLENAFGIHHTDLGILVAAVSFAAALFTIPAGVLADLARRKSILLAGIALWTLGEVASGAATSFTFLLLVRLFLGATSAVAAPAVATLVGDFFPPQARGRIYGVVLGGELVGAGFGFLFSGGISILLNWRWSLFLMGAPGVLVFLAVWFFLAEPARGGQSWIRLGQEQDEISGVHETERPGRSPTGPAQNSEAPEEADEGIEPDRLVRESGIAPRRELVLPERSTHWSLLRVVRHLLRVPTYVLLIIASSLGYYFFAGVRAFAMIFLTEHFHVSRGAAVLIAAIIGCGSLAGVLTGGFVSQRILDRGRIDARIIVPGFAILLAVIFLAPGIWLTNVFISVPLLALGFAALGAANPPIDAARLDIVPSAIWGRGEAGRTSLRAICEGGAPILFGVLSELLGGDGRGLEWTFLLMLIPLLIDASLAIPARLTYPRDVATAAASEPRAIKAADEERLSPSGHSR